MSGEGEEVKKTCWLSLFALPLLITDATYMCCERTGVSQVTLSHPSLDFSVTMDNVLEVYEQHSLAIIKEKMEQMIVILCQGGYFSMGYFEHGKTVIHKSFHRVISKKTNEYDEYKHKDEVDKLFEKWKDYMDKARVIFYHAPSTNKQFIITKDKTPRAQYKNLLQGSDPRICKLPISCARPCQAELMKVFKHITTVRVTSLAAEP